MNEKTDNSTNSDIATKLIEIEITLTNIQQRLTNLERGFSENPEEKRPTDQPNERRFFDLKAPGSVDPFGQPTEG